MDNKKSKLNFLKFIWKIIKTILIILLVLVFFVIVVQRVTNNNASVAGYGVYTVVSESMVPEYNLMDMLFAKKVDPATLEIGDDVIYQGKEGDFNGKIVTHRIISKKEDNGRYVFVTQGIANTLEDPAITGDQIYGKVVYKTTVLSYLSKVLNNAYGFYFLIFVPFVIIVTIEIIDTVNERKRLKKD